MTISRIPIRARRTPASIASPQAGDPAVSTPVPASGRRDGYLWLILALALGLRLWGIGWGLPYLYHPDEHGKVSTALHIFRDGDLNPHYFLKPGAYVYGNALAYAPLYWGGKWMGAWQSRSDLLDPVSLAMGTGYIAQPSLMLTGRALSVLFGLLTVYLVYRLGGALSGNPAVGRWAALLLAVSPTHALSKWMHPDPWATFFVVLCAGYSLRIYRTGRLRAAVMAGVSLGLAASCKYNGALAAICILAAFLWREGWRTFGRRGLYVAAGAGVAVFLATNPFALITPGEFWGAVSQEFGHYSTGHAGMEGNTPVWYLRYLAAYEGPVLALALWGLIQALARRDRATLALAVFPLCYAAVICGFIVRNDRMAMPLLPFAFIFAAQGLWQAWGWLKRRPRLRPAWRYAVAALMMAALLGAWPLRQTVAGNLALVRIDSRRTAADWITANLPAGSRVFIESYAPYLDPDRYQVTQKTTAIEEAPDWYVEQGIDYVIISQGMFGRYYDEPERYAGSVARYEQLIARYETAKLFTDGDYVIRILRVSEP